MSFGILLLAGASIFALKRPAPPLSYRDVLKYDFATVDRQYGFMAIDRVGDFYVANNFWSIKKLHAGAWTTLDGKCRDCSWTSMQLTGISTDLAGNLYAVGFNEQSGVDSHWIVRKYNAGIWTTIDDYQYKNKSPSYPRAVIADPSGVVYVAGFVLGPSQSGRWVVRKFQSGIWTTLDDYQPGKGCESDAEAMTIDSTGNLYVGGATLNCDQSDPDNYHSRNWTIRKYTGSSKKTMVQYSCGKSFDGGINALLTDATGNLYAAGDCLVAGNKFQALVRKFSAGSWHTLGKAIPSIEYQASTLAMNSNGDLYFASSGFNSESKSGAKNILQKYHAGDWTQVKGHDEISDISAMVADAFGKIYISGITRNSSGTHLQVSSLDQDHWKPFLDFAPNFYIESGAGVTSTSDGTIYAAGSAQNHQGITHWLVRKFSEGAWNTIDDYVYGQGFQKTFASATDTDANGNIYVAGGADGTDDFAQGIGPYSKTAHWLVRKYSSGSWTTIDDYQYLSKQPSHATAMAVGASGKIYVVGETTVKESKGLGSTVHSLVREFSDGTWKLIYDKKLYYDYPGPQLTAIAVDSAGQVYASGIKRTTRGDQWVVKKYNSTGWTDIDKFQLKSGFPSSPKAITTDASGNLYVGGEVTDENGVHWFVRKFGAGKWTTMENYQYTRGKNSGVTSLMIDPAGNVYAAGYGEDEEGRRHWLIRTFDQGQWRPLQDELPSGFTGGIPNGMTYLSGTHTLISIGDGQSGDGTNWITQGLPQPFLK